MTVEIVQRQDDGRVFTDMADDPANPCVACGACCSGVRVSFYQGEVADLGGTVPADWVHSLTPFLMCMKGTEAGAGRCAALAGEVGQAGIHCRIYAQRSSTCRAFRAWDDDGQASAECSRARQSFGLPPLAWRAAA